MGKGVRVEVSRAVGGQAGIDESAADGSQKTFYKRRISPKRPLAECGPSTSSFELQVHDL